MTASGCDSGFGALPEGSFKAYLSSLKAFKGQMEGLWLWVWRSEGFIKV